jgi:alpha-N-acetylglucosaminidase
MTVADSSTTSIGGCAAVEEMIGRVIGQRSAEFCTELVASDASTEFFELSGGGGECVLLQGNSPSALARAFNHYLKFICKSHVSVCGSRIDLPVVLPAIESVVRVNAPFQYRYCFNYCTFSYSMAFWDWQRWEQQIDWMALAGINLPLAITGQEAVWQRVYNRLGLTDAELSEFFSGPAFLAWNWMGNLDGWGGPTTQAWIDQQRELQTRILNRQRELGMKPVLPAFTGHVPSALARKFPELRIKRLHDWAENFPGTFFLDPLEPLFQEIGHAFIREQQLIYGVDSYGAEHFYSCDSFNENTPPSTDPVDLARISERLFQAMAGVDPDAVWVLQGWMFHFNPDDPGFWQMPQIHGLLDAVPDDRMIVLDLQSESFPLWKRTEASCGKKWIWCFLHNFGGHQSMFGNYDRLAEDLIATLDDPDRGRLVGMGIAPEGFAGNPILYDLATDLMWTSGSEDTDRWLLDYVERRYGHRSLGVRRAWNILRKTVYARPTALGGTTGTLLNLSPRIASAAALHYSPADLVPALESLVSVAKQFETVDPFRFDLVDVARQILSDFAGKLHDRAIADYLMKDARGLRKSSARFLELIEDLDRLLSTRREFLLGAWLEDAKAGAADDVDLAMRERNARMQITTWGDEQSMLRDYARKQWSGLLTDFYGYRWRAFFGELSDCLTGDREYQDAPFQHRLRAWEATWTKQTNLYPREPTGDSISIVTVLLKKYGPLFREAYEPSRSLVTGCTATASEGTSAAHRPERAITGTACRTSFWCADGLPQWIAIDLQKVQKIGGIHLFFYWDGERHYQYLVETSIDGAVWSAAADRTTNAKSANPAGERLPFSQREARFLRVTVTGSSANGAAHILDIRAYS